jgi:two-component sensor histidine kinase
MPARVFEYGVPPQRIRTFLILFALALSLPLIFLGVYALYSMASLEQAETERRVLAAAERITADIDRELDRATVILETLATSEALRQRDWRAFHARAVLALKRTDAAIVLIDRNYQQLVDTLKQYGAELPKTADIDTARRVFDTKQRQVSDLFRGSISGRPVFNVEVPVFENGDIPFVLIMSFRASHIADLLKAARLEPPWITGVTDRKGVILARSEGHDEFVGRELPAELLAQSRVATGVFRGTSVAGEQILRATKRSQIAGWLVSAAVPVTYADAPRTRGQAFAAAMVATAIIVGLALAYVFAGFMTRPLSAATVAAEQMGRGTEVRAVRSPLVEANILTSTLSAASSELKKRQDHAEFLMRELAHRAKNQLAVIQGMTLQTATQSQTVEQFASQLSQRIQALAQSQDLLVRQNWQGAWLGDLVRAHLDLFAATPRAQICGPDLFLEGSAVQNIGFALHELATNAAKYGALSRPGGQVHVTWQARRDEQKITLEWRELHDGGAAKSERPGFGSVVLTQLVPRALQATVKLEFGAQGVYWRIDMPDEHVLNRQGDT